MMAARNPIREALAGGARSRARSRQAAMWAAMRRIRRGIGVEALRPAAGGNARVAQDYLRRLATAGYIEPAAVRRVDQPALYNLVRDQAHAPAINRAGQAAESRGQVAGQMWQAMRILKPGFSAADLAYTASTEFVRVPVQSARAYLWALRLAGYVIGTRERPRAGARMRYSFVARHYHGPQAPVVMEGQLYDPNIDRVIWFRENVHE